jgi:molybdopterin-binding protein
VTARQIVPGNVVSSVLLTAIANVAVTATIVTASANANALIARTKNE